MPIEVRRFLGDNRPDKRAKLIDELLERPEFADWWALKWSDLLRNEEKQLDKKGVQVFYDWIRGSIADNKPLNEFARELIAARGSTYTEPAANYYRALREPETRAEAAAQVFLGIRMQCAKCHNHPFDQWTQNDYHRLPPSSPASSTTSSRTTARTSSTRTSSSASRSSGWTSKARSSTP